MAQLGLIRTSQPIPASGFAGAQGEYLMKKTLTAFVAAATVASAIAAMPTAADARCDGCAVGAGVLGGLVAGAIIGGAVANARPAPVYVEVELVLIDTELGERALHRLDLCGAQLLVLAPRSLERARIADAVAQMFDEQH